ncbi:ABC transporter ATP-binding protein [Xaviernesmea oryzae]|uniref:ABC transporter ATP-binding protein n=1 Tax=Xaviernesmea oryzae TaxID=464029 RepID=A0A1Q9AQM4_9HYPH|nr:ABC transporter ATP-binding protein [Xaviernesmea oryzae]OLP57714.1 ABC transporter ATP-binding protein [Xaviernesmea oryzae]SEM05403.1 peptide/nickel transport system ATP-binding protein [Xaviernesmea oryzae]
MSALVLDIDRLSITSGARRLVEEISLRVAPGERVGLIGESGSGKSLTALASVGLLAEGLVPSGSIRLGGHQVVGAADSALAKLRGEVAAMVFQEPLTALDPLMPIGRQLAEVVRRHARRNRHSMDRRSVERAVLDLVRQVSLPHPDRLVRSFPHEISGGQRQRVAIAMALACEPQLLIADEPTTALDVTTQAEILTLLRDLVTARNMALLFISHDLPVVAGIAERVIVMRQGAIVEEGTVSQVFAKPAHAYTKSLMAAARSFDDALEIPR